MATKQEIVSPWFNFRGQLQRTACFDHFLGIELGLWFNPCETIKMGLNEPVFQHTEHENKLTASECIRTCASNHLRAALTSLPGMSRKSESSLSQEESMEVDCNHCVFEDSSELRDLDAADVKDMRLEAQAVVNDVLFAVREMYVAHSLQNAVDVAHINVETREGNRYCLELTEAGLRVVGYAFDQVDESMMTQYHETVYSLLDSLSPAYREAFGNALLQRLERLKQNGR